MLKRWWTRFAAWFFAPVIRLIVDMDLRAAHAITGLRGELRADGGKLRADLSNRIDDLRIELIAHMSEVKAELGYAMAEKQDSFPVLSMEALEAWEAVQFAASKWERDPQDMGSREREILRLIANGHSNREIGEMLVISVNTVEAHRGHIMQKLNLHTRAELVRYAIKSGLID